MNLSKNDWIGLGASVGLHLVLLVLFTFMNLGVSDPQPVGYIQVEFGDFAEGQPVRRTPDPRPEVQEVVPDPEPEPVEQPEPQTAPPEDARPVDLPDQPEVVDEEKITSPETETISPEEQNDPAPVVGPEPKPERPPVQPLGGGDPEGRAGAEQGDDGEGQDARKTAPFQIEGLDRRPVQTPLPVYREKVNATIRVRITVDPQGRIVGRLPLIKGNPALEQAVMDALQQWRFNPLPANAPQENQTGTITFVFRLE